jgi:molybdopterin synthase catalytic subunit
MPHETDHSPQVHLRLTDDPIDVASVTESVRTPLAGAVVLFLGTVREFTGAARTLRMEYDAYRSMAEVQLRSVVDEAVARWPIARVSVEHRLGRLELGDVSVAVAVSTAHRAAAFEAGRYIIDRLKETVPIWKREHLPDGTTEWIHPEAAPVVPPA